MAIGRSQMTKQVDGQLRGARKLKKVAKGLAKASKTLKGILSGSSKRNGKKA
jgi:hypothetical protein